MIHKQTTYTIHMILETIFCIGWDTYMKHKQTKHIIPIIKKPYLHRMRQLLILTTNVRNVCELSVRKYHGSTFSKEVFIFKVVLSCQQLIRDVVNCYCCRTPLAAAINLLCFARYTLNNCLRRSLNIWLNVYLIDNYDDFQGRYLVTTFISHL